VAVTSTYSSEYRRLIGALVAARKSSGLTQQTLAGLLGKPQSFVSKIENGERRLDVLEFVQVAQAVGADYRKIIDTAIGE
jgi:transcriptional regulator with XRE-family HTH domain